MINHAAGQGAERALGLVLPAEASLSWEVLATGQPARVEDFRHDERVAKAARENLDLGPAILFPLGGPGDARGVLTVGRHPGGVPLDQPAAELVTTFAAQAGIALELAERRRDAERLAVFEDRDRIARDLHDLVIQRLYASGMKLQGTIPLIERRAAQDRVSSVVDDMDVTITDIRQAIFDLQARGTAAPGLRDKVMAVIEEMAEPMGMTLTLRLDSRLDEQVPGDIGEDMLHALREALSNAARHGKATGVEVSIRLGSELSLLVRDNGTGFPATSRRSGLANLARRAEQYDGTLTVGPAQGGGTELQWRVPLPARGAAEEAPGTLNPGWRSILAFCRQTAVGYYQGLELAAGIDLGRPWAGGAGCVPVGFVGRERELSRLEGALGGDARLVLVVGDAGVGKTRFAGECMRRAAAGGWSVSWGVACR